jgi:hypothetical protein
MVPLLVRRRIKYDFVRNILIGDCPLGNAPTSNGHAIKDILSTGQEKTLDDLANSLMKYQYVFPLSGLHFIVHQQSPIFIIIYVEPTWRSTSQLFNNTFNEQQILTPNYNELANCIMYFPRVAINLNGNMIHMPKRIIFEGRKSDTLWMLVSAGLSTGFSTISPNIGVVNPAIDEITK